MAYTNLPPKITDAAVTISFSADGVTASGAYWGYCTKYDVLYEFPQQATMTTINPGTSSATAPHPIGQEITYAAFELHKLLEHLYQMPYTGNDAGIWGTLRDLNAKLAVSNLIERYFQGSEPNLSQAAAERKAWVAGKVEDLRTGIEQWGTPFGDAVRNAMAPLYDLSAAATVSPSPSSADPNAQTPMFSIGRTPFKSDMM